MTTDDSLKLLSCSQLFNHPALSEQDKSRILALLEKMKGSQIEKNKLLLPVLRGLVRSKQAVSDSVLGAFEEVIIKGK